VARLDLPTLDVQPVVVVPGQTPSGSDASSATGSPSCPPTAPRRTWRRDCTGPCSLNTVAKCSSTPPASCGCRLATALPTGSFDGPML
jgi:hypothetical protein